MGESDRFLGWSLALNLINSLHLLLIRRSWWRLLLLMVYSSISAWWSNYPLGRWRWGWTNLLHGLVLDIWNLSWILHPWMCRNMWSSSAFFHRQRRHPSPYALLLLFIWVSIRCPVVLSVALQVIRGECGSRIAHSSPGVIIISIVGTWILNQSPSIPRRSSCPWPAVGYMVTCRIPILSLFGRSRMIVTVF